MGMKARANVATFFKYFVLILMGFIMVYPLLWMVGSTFKTNAEIFTSFPRLPRIPPWMAIITL